MKMQEIISWIGSMSVLQFIAVMLTIVAIQKLAEVLFDWLSEKPTRKTPAPKLYGELKLKCYKCGETTAIILDVTSVTPNLPVAEISRLILHCDNCGHGDMYHVIVDKSHGNECHAILIRGRE